MGTNKIPKNSIYPETKSPFLGPKPDWMQLAPATTIQKYFLKMQVVPGTKIRGYPVRMDKS
jgi:hypothetical protein